MSVFVRSTLIFAVALATSASQTIERFREGDHRILVGRALITQDGGGPVLTELLVVEVPGADPRAFPSAQLSGLRWRDGDEVLIP